MSQSLGGETPGSDLTRGYNNEEDSLKKPCSKDEAQPTVLEELAGPDGAGLQVPQGEDIPPRCRQEGDATAAGSVRLITVQTYGHLSLNGL